VRGDRRDPLNGFKKYRQGYDVKNKHYWAVRHFIVQIMPTFYFWAYHKQCCVNLAIFRCFLGVNSWFLIVLSLVASMAFCDS
jgi:hypothetical protein